MYVVKDVQTPADQCAIMGFSQIRNFQCPIDGAFFWLFHNSMEPMCQISAFYYFCPGKIVIPLH